MGSVLPCTSVVVSDVEPSIPPNGYNIFDWKWFQPSTGRWYSYDSGWVLLGGDPQNIGSVNFNGSVLADGNAGLTGTRVVGNHKLTFTKGLLTGFEAA